MAPALSEISDGLSTLSDIIRNKSWILRHGSALLKMARRRRRPRLMVFGAGGTGKSSLGRTLARETSFIPEYRVSSLPEESDVAQMPFAKSTIFPGQQRRREGSFPDVMSRLSHSGFDGVVHVVSYGYHSLSQETWRDHELALSVADHEEFTSAWTECARLYEIDALKEIKFALENARGRLRMITLINKEDLWWPDRAAVSSFYDKGEYGETIEAIRKARGRADFDHFFVPCSLQVMNFRTQTEVLRATAPGYEQSRQTATVADLERYLAALLWAGS